MIKTSSLDLGYSKCVCEGPFLDNVQARIEARTLGLDLLGILKILWNISLLLLVVNYNVLTNMYYKVQISSKITDLDGYLSL